MEEENINNYYNEVELKITTKRFDTKPQLLFGYRVEKKGNIFITIKLSWFETVYRKLKFKILGHL